MLNAQGKEVVVDFPSKLQQVQGGNDNNKGNQVVATVKGGTDAPPAVSTTAYALMGKDWEAIHSFHSARYYKREKKQPGAGAGGLSSTSSSGEDDDNEVDDAKESGGASFARNIPHFNSTKLLIVQKQKEDQRRVAEEERSKEKRKLLHPKSPSPADELVTSRLKSHSPNPTKGYLEEEEEDYDAPMPQELGEQFGYQWFYGPSWNLKRYRTQSDSIAAYCSYGELRAGQRVLLPSTGATFRVIGEYNAKLGVCQDHRATPMRVTSRFVAIHLLWIGGWGRWRESWVEGCVLRTGFLRLLLPLVDLEVLGVGGIQSLEVHDEVFIRGFLRGFSHDCLPI